ncbi:MAG: hypothetical protein ACRENH_12050 [Gemmatimonadaceae bacterium]
MKLAHLVCLTSVATIGLAGCRKSQASDDHRIVERPVVERSDQMAITTQDGNVVLALTKANKVAMRLSDSLRQHVDAEIAKDFAREPAESAFGRWVQRMTATAVSKGMGIELSIPVRDIEDARYQDGEIQFEYRSDRRQWKFNSFKRDGHSPLAGFRPEDAERFVEAVRDAIHSRKT